MKTVLALLLALLAGAAPAQDYPAKPVRIIVPYVAGGNGDIGTDYVAKSAPDGYTLLAVASGPIVVNPVLYSHVPYDPLRDLAPVAQCAVYQYVLVTRADAPYKRIQDLVADARAHPAALA